MDQTISADHSLADTLAAPDWSSGLTRIPYWLFQREDIAAAEQTRVFQGPTWNFLGLEAEIAKPGDYRTTQIGDTPVVMVRNAAGVVHAFENRCAHRGALIAVENQGNAAKFACVYHAWTYSQEGDLTGVAFQKGVKGQGGMPDDFRREDHGPRKLRVALMDGLVFASFRHDVPSLEEYLGEELTGRVHRVFLGRTPKILGRFTQVLPNNWKLYAENTRDSYHASILHLFFATFQLNRLGMKGGIIVNEQGGSHVSWSSTGKVVQPKDNDYTDQNIRSDSGYKLHDPTLLRGFDEFPDGITLQILSVFPGFILQQIQNALAVRQIVPRGPDKTDLHWTYFGFEEDTPEQTHIRLTQSNLMGPAGFVSMEDGCVGGYIQRGIAGAANAEAVVQMGGSGADSQESRVTESSVRGFWKAYRATMGI
jgi:anthranilate 1,2-dioxygenase large subunit